MNIKVGGSFRGVSIGGGVAYIIIGPKVSTIIFLKIATHFVGST